MALNIKSDKADRLARKLADRTGESITQAVIHAIEARLASLDFRDADEQAQEDAALDEIIAQLKTLAERDLGTDEDLLGYDESGAWR
jgi:antitoxin VapB